MNKTLGWLTILFLNLVLTGCSSIQTASTNDYSLSAVYAAIEKSLSMGVLKTEANRRITHSKPFKVTQSDDAKKDGYHERGVATVWVSGDSRPYTIDVEVRIERAKVQPGQSLDSSTFEKDRSDGKLAKRLLKNILDNLDRMEKNLNVIDDFRPF